MSLPYAFQASDFPSFRSSITLTNAQIKALPTTEIEVVPTPGPGFAIIVFAVGFTKTFIAGYTATDPSPQLFNPNGNGQGLSPVTPFSLSTGTHSYLVTGAEGSVTSGGTFDGYITAGSSLVENDNVTIGDHWATGDYTGGDSLNTLKVTAYYGVVPV